MKRILYILFFICISGLASGYNLVKVGSEYINFNITGIPDTSSGGGASVYAIQNVTINRLHIYINSTNVNGSDGDKYRVVGLNNLNLSKFETVVLDNFQLQKDIDYNITHAAANSTIQFMNNVWDNQTLTVDYFTVSPFNVLVFDSVYTGASLSGADGTILRNLTLSNTALTVHEEITVDNFRLQPLVDYAITHGLSLTNITFNNKVWNEQNIHVRYYEI